jgi:transcriptional regulator GlxA family with amidase domain
MSQHPIMADRLRAELTRSVILLHFSVMPIPSAQGRHGRTGGAAGHRGGSFHVVFCVVPGFALTSLAVGVDALRVANRMAGRQAFRWTVLSPDGTPIVANCGLSVVVDGRFPGAQATQQPMDDPDMVAVVAGFSPQDHCSRPLLRWIGECRRRGRMLAGIASGAFMLAEAGALKDRRCTIHWENRSSLAERFPGLDIRSQIYVVDRGIYTCGGSSSVFDMMLRIVTDIAGPATAARVAEQSLLSTVRPAEMASRQPIGASLSPPGELVARAIELMEERISEPCSVTAIAAALGVPVRRLERRFEAELGEAPGRYHRRLRVEHAARLLLQTRMAVTEIGIACGFQSRAHFSRAYRAVMDRTPSEERARARQPGR